MNVVITGSSKGIGFGMAEEFVRRGHNVVVSSRRGDAVQAAVAKLNSGGSTVATGIAADVANIEDVQALWRHAVETFGKVDIWINNAGITNESGKLHELPQAQFNSVVGTNLIGLFNCCKIAIGGMLEQGSGKIFNMEGFGSDGLTRSGLSVYGSTKYALRYVTKSLVKEYEDTNLIIGYLSPGIVVTDLLTKDLYDVTSPDFQKRKKFLNIIADRVETVTPFLVEGILNSSKSGSAVRWMSPVQAIGRFLKSFFVKRDLFAELEKGGS